MVEHMAVHGVVTRATFSCNRVVVTVVVFYLAPKKTQVKIFLRISSYPTSFSKISTDSKHTAIENKKLYNP